MENVASGPSQLDDGTDRINAIRILISPVIPNVAITINEPYASDTLTEKPEIHVCPVCRQKPDNILSG